MSIALQHLQCLVASNGRHLHRVETFLEEPACGFVTEIVKGEIDEVNWIRRSFLLNAFLFVRDPSPGDSPPPSYGNGVRLDSPNLSVDSPDKTGENRTGFGGEIYSFV